MKHTQLAHETYTHSNLTDHLNLTKPRYYLPIRNFFTDQEGYTECPYYTQTGTHRGLFYGYYYEYFAFSASLVLS